MAKLTDIQKKKIIADYIDCQNYSETAKMNGVSHTSVMTIINEADGEVFKKLQDKKEENVRDVLKYMESKKTSVCGIIDLYLNALTNPDKLEKASLQQVATSMGIVIDKFTKDNVQSSGSVEEHNLLIDAIKNLPKDET